MSRVRGRLEDVTVHYAAKDALLQLMETIPGLAINAMKVQSILISKLKDRIASFSAGSLQNRLVLALLELSEGTEAGSDGMITVQGPITHEYLSSVVGASREAVTIALKKLKDSKAIVQRGRGDLAVEPQILRCLVA